MKRLFVIFLSVIIVLADDNPVGEQCEVVAPIGRIRGSTMTSRLGRKIFSFRGVRYAEPPTGQYRFQVAIPAANWTDVFDATKEGPACPAISEQNIMEDCLRVNIYTTKLPSENDPVKRAVLIFFHPGSFYLFSGQSYNFGPQYLLDKDIVLVTVNYRLASLDGLAHINSDSSIIFPMHRSVRLIAENCDQPVYFYMSSYQGRYSYVMWNETAPYGVAHYDDLQYLFFMKIKFPFFENDAPEIPMVDLMTSIWSNFVQTGQPVSPALEAKNVTWEPYLPERDNYLKITEEPTMKTGLYPDRMQKWDSLFPLNPIWKLFQYLKSIS
ncbi:PREDICTED: esterase FE4-like [Wasmannia auropunctata]|uniref:esterase FE4-like n=1 Tax=Wasmannia auropunctata TaxID=64793 RepID=UPI0005F063D3|nr:PREDICTED: esterase FE4-like [Wasmannia auropunctata]